MKTALKDPTKMVPLLITALFFLTVCFNNSPHAAKVIFYPIYREVKKHEFFCKSREYSVLSSRNFRIFYKNVSPDTLALVENQIEDNLQNILDDLAYELGTDINVVVYSDYNEMSEKIGLESGSTAMGVYYEGIISILDPEKWVEDKSKMDEIFIKYGPMVHELTHLVVDYMTFGNVPVWFTEGIALYEEYRINGVLWAEDKTYKDYYNMRELEQNFYELDETKAYKQSLIMVNYIIENYGMEGIISIINELGRGRNMDQAVQRSLNIDKYELFQRSLSEVKTERLKCLRWRNVCIYIDIIIIY